MIVFEKITADTVEIVQEMFRSNDEYCKLEYGGDVPSLSMLTEEFCGVTSSYFVKADETYIGIIDYMENNPNDGFPWLGFLMIHGDYQGYGYGTNAYFLFEEKMKKLGKVAIRLGVMKENTSAKHFWEELGFSFFEEKESNKKIIVDCYEKKL